MGRLTRPGCVPGGHGGAFAFGPTIAVRTALVVAHVLGVGGGDCRVELAVSPSVRCTMGGAALKTGQPVDIPDDDGVEVGAALSGGLCTAIGNDAIAREGGAEGAAFHGTVLMVSPDRVSSGRGGSGNFCSGSWLYQHFEHHCWYGSFHQCDFFFGLRQ